MADVAEQGLKQALEAEREVARPGNLRVSWEALFDDARSCTRCHLYKHATQTVFGEGPLDAKILFVGEQPGDAEDLAGRPFVGPAGQLFDQLLEKAGVDRKQTYVTNAVKHFKFVPRGKRRIHNKPDAGEIQACRWWFEHERELIRPPVTVALGATAARSLLGKIVTIGKVRGKPLTLEDGSECWVTTHPSALLRMPEREKRREARELFVKEMRQIWRRAEELERSLSGG
jgi:uracil-DNA glycosylase family protein